MTDNHADELCFVFGTQLERYLLKAVDDEVSSAFFCWIPNQRKYLFEEKFSSWALEVGVEMIGKFFGIVGDDLDLELGHGGAHDFAGDSVDNLVGVGVEQILEKMHIVGVLLA